MCARFVSLLGSTGSIGQQTLDVIRTTPEFYLVSLASRHLSEELLLQIEEFRPEFVAVYDEDNPDSLSEALRSIGSPARAGVGPDAVAQAAAWESATHTVVAVSGVNALLPTLEAISTGKTICLATKEILVAAGDLVVHRAAQAGTQIIPVDSEHSAVWQSVQGEKLSDISSIALTASGGPFLLRSLSSLRSVTVSEALQHPTWKMGPKITVDSATMMNKGLEIIEAMALFGLTERQIDVVIHPESIIHAIVTMRDGCSLAQLSRPDMRLPIQYALAYPERLPRDSMPLDMARLGSLTFLEPETERYPCLELAREAARRGKLAPCALNGANEAAVDLFLGKMIGFLDIPRIVEKVLEHNDWDEDPTIENIVQTSAKARAMARSLLPAGVS